MRMEFSVTRTGRVTSSAVAPPTGHRSQLEPLIRAETAPRLGRAGTVGVQKHIFADLGTDAEVASTEIRTDALFVPHTFQRETGRGCRPQSGGVCGPSDSQPDGRPTPPFGWDTESERARAESVKNRRVRDARSNIRAAQKLTPDNS